MSLWIRWCWLFLVMGLPAAARSQPEIPSHPRQLQFEGSEPSLPTTEGLRYELESGPVVYIVEDHTLPLVEIGLATRAGSYLDPPESAGLASMTATQLRRGGSGTRGPDEFDDRVDDLGAQMDSKAGGSRAGATLSVPTWSLPEALDLFFDMISAPTFEASRLDNARRSLLESLSRRNEDPLKILEREWGWLLYGRDHFTTRPLTPATLESIGRDEVVAFHRRYWNPQQMILAVSGDIEAEEILQLLDERFSRWDSSGAETPLWPPPSPSSGVEPGLFHYEFDAPQAKILLGHRFDTLFEWQDRDRFVLAVVAEILGGRGAISRIGGRLRTSEGLVYRVLLNLEPGDFWPGEFQIFFETKSDSVSRAIALTLEEIERLRSEPPHPGELAVAQRILTARIAQEFDTAEEIAGYFAGDEFVGRPSDYWQWMVDAISSVTPAEVQEAARTYLRPECLIYLIVGRWAEIGIEGTSNLSDLEEVVGFEVEHLPIRNPTTLEAKAAPESASD